MNAAIRFWCFLLLVVLLNGLLISHFYNRAWYAQDAGVFAHTAERLIAQESGTPPIDDVHPGYLNGINAAALALFGRDFLSLNYPLMAVVMLQAILVFVCFYRRSPATAVLASLVPSALGVFQFINPNHHWYAFFLSIMTALLLSTEPKEGSGRRFFAGIMIATIFLFRQLTGVFMGIGVLAFFILEDRGAEHPAAQRKEWLGIGALLFFSFALTMYFLRVTDLTGLVLFGVSALVLLWVERRLIVISDRKVRTIVYQFGSGILFGFLPMIITQAASGQLGSWLYHTFFASIGVLNQGFLSEESYFRIIFGALWVMLTPTDAKVFINALFWLLLTVMPFINFVMLMRRLRDPIMPEAHDIAVPFLAIFYSLVALHYQIPAYLAFSVGLSVLGVLWMSKTSKPRTKIMITMTVAYLVAVGLIFHAGRTLNRLYLLGDPGTMTYAASEIKGLSLWVDAEDLKVYKDVIAMVKNNTGEGDAIFAVPNDAELYFLTGRKNPFQFFSTDHGVHSEAGLSAVLQHLKTHPPRLIIDRPADKRHTPWSKRIMAYVETDYVLLKSIGSFKIYAKKHDQ